MKRAFLLACLLAVAAVSPAQGSLEVLPPRHRSAEQVIPALRGLVEPGGAITGQGYQIFVRTSPANVDELKRALAAIDSPQRRLVISVRFDGVLSSRHARSAQTRGVWLRVEESRP